MKTKCIPKAISSGIVIDMAEPDLRGIDVFEDIAMPLGKMARFDGQMPGRKYSVAQHCSVGADAVFRETGDYEAALAFLLHDAHEAFIGDITTPTATALADLCGPGFRFGLAWLKDRFDNEIYKLAGIEPGSDTHEIVRTMDRRMLNTERKLFLSPKIADEHWHESIIAAPVVKTWSVKFGTMRAARGWFQRFNDYRDKIAEQRASVDADMVAA